MSNVRALVSGIHPVTLRSGSARIEGTLARLEETLENGEAQCKLELSFAGRRISGRGRDFFEALLEVRRTLEPEATFLLVYGASRNVWPSGMARSMGAGLKAYRMTMGNQALLKDLVGIFESGPDVEPATIAEQERYRDEWFASLGREP